MSPPGPTSTSPSQAYDGRYGRCYRSGLAAWSQILFPPHCIVFPLLSQYVRFRRPSLALPLNSAELPSTDMSLLDTPKSQDLFSACSDKQSNTQGNDNSTAYIVTRLAPEKWYANSAVSVESANTVHYKHLHNRLNNSLQVCTRWDSAKSRAIHSHRTTQRTARALYSSTH